MRTRATQRWWLAALLPLAAHAQYVSHGEGTTRVGWGYADAFRTRTRDPSVPGDLGAPAARAFFDPPQAGWAAPSGGSTSSRAGPADPGPGSAPAPRGPSARPSASSGATPGPTFGRMQGGAAATTRGAAADRAAAARARWRAQLSAARARLAQADASEVVQALASDRAADQAAALEQVRDRPRVAAEVPDGRLAEVMGTTRDPRVARAAASLLDGRGGPVAARALAAQVRGDGPARALATRFLRRADPGALRRALAVDPRRFRLLARVRRARGADPRTVRAVGQLAAYPDAEVTALLRQLTRDLSPALAAAAREALAAQQAAGGAGP